MKKIIKRFWGVGLVIIILSSLFVAAAPVSAADPLMWNEEKVPGAATNAITAGFTIKDMVHNGDTFYAVGSTATDNCTLYKSVDGGKTWTLNNDDTTLLGFGVTGFWGDYVAVAPDDPNTLVVVDATNLVVFVSTSGGAMWNSLGAVTGASAIYDVDIAPIALGARNIAIAGDASIYLFALGTPGATWTAKNPATGVVSFRAVKFSPSYASDYIVVSVSVNTTHAALHAFSLNGAPPAWKWDSAIGYFDSYPANIAAATAITKASLTLSPDYMGGDDTLRVSFVGLTGTGATDPSNIYRLSDTRVLGLTTAGTQINSVDYNGTAVVAGSYNTNVTYYCTDPLATTPTVFPARSYKRIGLDDAGNDQVVVSWYGADVTATKRGDAGAFSHSLNNGLTWNDISLINEAITNITDIYVAPDASKWYVACNNVAITSVYRYDGSWARILNLTGTPNLILRGAPEDANAIYVAQNGGTALYFSADAGETRWYNRTAPGTMTDVAAESKDIVYIGAGTSVQKSTNQGFTWGPPGYPTTGGDVYNIHIISANNLVVGSSTGYVGYSADGGATYTKITAPIAAAGAMVTADGLAAGGIIYAAIATSDAAYRYVIGTDKAFVNMSAPATATYLARGIVLNSGTLYIATQNGTNSIIQRNVTPFLMPVATAALFWDTAPYNLTDASFTAGIAASVGPDALKISSGSAKLWVVNTSGTSNKVYSYVDTLVDTAPGLTTPVDLALIAINPTNNAAMPVTFSWTRPSLATGYTIKVALNAGLTDGLQMVTVTGPGSSAPSVTKVAVSPTDLYLVPGTTYYWGVMAKSPISGKTSEVRSLTVQPMTAAVPGIASPINGATIASQNPAFSWTPVTGTLKYDFALSTSPTFETTVYTATPASAGTVVPSTITLDKGKQYFWRVRALEPVQGDWSTAANFIVAAAAPPAAPPVVITSVPAPIITIPAAPPAQTVTLNPPAVEQIAPTYIWAIIIIGAILVIAVIVLIVRTRRSV